jgi:hypothetical protein
MLERGAALLVERGYFAVVDHAFGWQLLNRIEQLWIIERLLLREIRRTSLPSLKARAR